MVSHFIVGDLSRHAVATHNALCDTVESGWDECGHTALYEFDEDHPAEIGPIFLGRGGGENCQGGGGHGGKREPSHLAIGVVHNVTSRRLKQELRHAEDEEENARLLLGVVFRYDEEGTLHVDHGQAIAELAEEEGHEAQEEARGDFARRHDGVDIASEDDD